MHGQSAFGALKTLLPEAPQKALTQGTKRRLSKELGHEFVAFEFVDHLVLFYGPATLSGASAD